MNDEKCCCVTGHRDIPPEKREMIAAALREGIANAVANGYTRFISGFATGADLLFAELVLELKATHAVKLEAAIPYPGRMKTRDSAFQRLIGHCDIIKTHSREYTMDCYRKRNHYMVDEASLVFAVWDGRESGGTAATVRYARRLGRSVLVVGCVD